MRATLSIFALTVAAVVAAQAQTGTAPVASTPSGAATASVAAPSATPSSSDGVAAASAQSGWKNVPLRDLVALVNLGVVVWIFFQNRSDRIRERRTDRDERKAKLRLEIGLFWMQRIVIEPNEQFMFEFFAKYTKKLEDIPVALPAEGTNVGDLKAQARAEIAAFKDDLRIFRRKVEEPLVWISPLFVTVSETLRAIEDLVTESLYVIPGVIDEEAAKQKPSDELQKLRRELFERLYSAQREFSQRDDA